MAYIKATERIGKKYGKWTVLRREKKGGVWGFFCRCECGNEKWVQHNVVLGHSEGCRDCYGANVLHGMHGSREYAWWAMHKYGYRNLCSRWLTFRDFFGDVGTFDGKHPARPDVSRPFGPNNFRMQDKFQTVKIPVKAPWGEISQAEAARLLGISRERARVLHNRGRLEPRLQKLEKPNGE